jgi:hypothetical protein
LDIVKILRKNFLLKINFFLRIGDAEGKLMSDDRWPMIGQRWQKTIGGWQAGKGRREKEGEKMLVIAG